MRVCVVGAGYAGLVGAAGLAAAGHAVTCVDADPDRVALIAAGTPPFHEPGLADLLRQQVSRRALRAGTDLAGAVRDAEVTLIAVGTPSLEDGRVDLGQVEAAATRIGAALRDSTEPYPVVVLTSTAPPGTTRTLLTPLLEAASARRDGADLGVATSPEFLAEGSAVAEALHPDRVVLGAAHPRTLDLLAELYRPLLTPPAETLRTDPDTAELTKYAANALLATLVSFSNEIADLAEAAGVDVVEVLRGVRLDRRLSPVVDGVRLEPGVLAYLAAGCGFGGSCLPKDLRALLAGTALPLPVLRGALATNRTRAARLLDQLRAGLGGELAGARVTVLGAAFKPGTDDVRESPALPVIEGLLAAGARVTLHDPVALDAARRALDDAPVHYRADLAEALAGADAAVLVTAWSAYRDLPALLPRTTLLVDGRRLIEPAAVARYRGPGAGAASSPRRNPAPS